MVLLFLLIGKYRIKVRDHAIVLRICQSFGLIYDRWEMYCLLVECNDGRKVFRFKIDFETVNGEVL
jgi:hypothetical protein